MTWQYATDIGHNSVLGIIAAAKSSGINLTVTSTISGTHADHSLHFSGNAVDFSNGSDTAQEAAFAQWIMDNYGGSTLQLIHSGGKGYYISDGAVVPASFYSDVLAAHHSHVHWAITNSGLAARLSLNGLKANALSGDTTTTAETVSFPGSGLLSGIGLLIKIAQGWLKVLNFLTDPHNWFRIAEFILGCGLLYLGLKGLNNAAINSTFSSVSSVTKKARATGKKAANRAGKTNTPSANGAAGEAKPTGKPQPAKGNLANGDAIPKTTNAAKLAVKETVG